jgi:hypothetical protein
MGDDTRRGFESQTVRSQPKCDLTCGKLDLGVCALSLVRSRKPPEAAGQMIDAILTTEPGAARLL